MLVHLFVNPHADGPDSTKTQPSNWNAEHSFTGSLTGSLLYRDTGQATGANWLPTSASAGYALISNGVGAAPSWGAVFTPSFPLSPTAGGTGVANAVANTITFSGNFGITFTLTGTTNVTFPQSGTLAVLGANTFTGQQIWIDGTAAVPATGFTSDTVLGFRRTGASVAYFANNASAVSFGIGPINSALGMQFNSGSASAGVRLASGTGLGWTGGHEQNAIDTNLLRTSQGIVSMVSSGASNAYRLPNGAGPEYGMVGWSSNVFEFGTVVNGGTNRNVRIKAGAAGSIIFQASGSDNWSVNSSGHFLALNDNATDIGATGATRPRTAYIATSVITPICGDVSQAFRLRGSLATPASLADGDWWLETDTGAVTGPNARLKARLNGVTTFVADSNLSYPRVFALTDGATPALDASKGSVFTLIAAGDRTIAVPTNAIDGQKIIIRHQASGGTRTLALNSGAGGFRFGTDVTALTITASGKWDYIGCVYNGTDSKWDVVAYSKGY